jgi:branched-chain amino acid transport system substrate-binding protein
MRFIKVLILSCLFFSLTVLVIPHTAFVRYPDSTQPVKIGLLLADSLSIAARNGAELAINEANKKGGLNGRSFELVVRSMEGPWGTGSKQAINLVFEEKVWAILGSHDGRNAHLAEQAAAKTHVVLMSAWPGDPTLSAAFVPWYFSCAPNDNQQADILIEEIYNRRNLTRVALVSDNDYDSRLAMESFIGSVKRKGQSSPLQFTCENQLTCINNLIDSISRSRANSIVLFGNPALSLRIIQVMRQRGMNQPIFGNLALLDENIIPNRRFQDYPDVIFVASQGWQNQQSMNFVKEYQSTWHQDPGMVAAFAFDGMNLLIEAIRNAGSPDREKIQDWLANARYKGVTGTIRFDERGNPVGNYNLISFRNGLPVEVEKR